MSKPSVVSLISVTRDGRHETRLPEQDFWLAMVLRAVEDARWVDPNPNGSPDQIISGMGGFSMRRRDLVRIRDEALVWLFYDEFFFRRACEFAGLNADYIRRKVRDLVEAANEPVGQTNT